MMGTNPDLQKLGTLRRSETTVTPEGRHRPYAARRASSQRRRKREYEDLPSSSSQSLEQEQTAVRGEFVDDINSRRAGVSSDSGKVMASARTRLAQFR